MFDDPNKALKKLQEQLLAAEEPEQDIFAPPPTEPEYEDYDTAEYGEESPEEEPEEEPEAPQEKNRNKVALLVALLLLEVALLFGVLAWWLLW